MSEPKSAYDPAGAARDAARLKAYCNSCPKQEAVNGYQADLRQSVAREVELCKMLLCVVANCEICGGTGHQEGSEYPGSEPCDSCAAALKLLAKYEKERS